MKQTRWRRVSLKTLHTAAVGFTCWASRNCRSFRLSTRTCATLSGSGSADPCREGPGGLPRFSMDGQQALSTLRRRRPCGQASSSTRSPTPAILSTMRFSVLAPAGARTRTAGAGTRGGAAPGPPRAHPHRRPCTTQRVWPERAASSAATVGELQLHAGGAPRAPHGRQRQVDLVALLGDAFHAELGEGAWPHLTPQPGLGDCRGPAEPKRSPCALTRSTEPLASLAKVLRTRMKRSRKPLSRSWRETSWRCDGGRTRRARRVRPRTSGPRCKASGLPRAHAGPAPGFRLPTREPLPA